MVLMQNRGRGSGRRGRGRDAVVSNLGKNNVMLISDNHISKPGWCCSKFDGSGFFGDQYFNPDLWIKGLTMMATLFKGTTNVVGMSFRNELRGPKQNVNDWYRYMQKGTEAVHAINSNVLVILSGLIFDKDLSFLIKRPVSLSFTGKLVFEVHWYGFSDGLPWKRGNPNHVCGRAMHKFMRKAGFVLEQGYPLFLSEFGVDLRGTDVIDNRYLNCLLGVAAELDFDWALCTLAGSYYLKEGVRPIQQPGQPGAKQHKVIFHPLTGQCLQRKSLLEPLNLDPCTDSKAWTYNTQQKTITIKGTYFCLQTDGLNKPVKLGVICSGSTSK
ncbi:unnamed protein product [Camellia sinensis]